MFDQLAGTFLLFTQVGVTRIGYVAMLLLAVLLPCCVEIHAQEYPYFVTYSQEMGETGNLDIEMFNAVGNPQAGNSFIGPDIEFVIM